jgi:hypothetical protein
MLPLRDTRLSVVLGALFVMLAAPVPAQSPGSRSCVHGTPLPSCRSFWIIEGEYLQPIVATTPVGSERPYLGYHVAGQLGLMINRESAARGVVLTGGISKPGPRWGLLVRERRWLTGTHNVDFSVGLIKATVRSPREAALYRKPALDAYGITGDVSLGWRDYAQITLRGDMVRSDEATSSALYGGARLGSRSARWVGGLALVYLVVGALALSA